MSSEKHWVIAVNDCNKKNGLLSSWLHSLTGLQVEARQTFGGVI